MSCYSEKGLILILLCVFHILIGIHECIFHHIQCDSFLVDESQIPWLHSTCQCEFKDVEKIHQLLFKKAASNLVYFTFILIGITEFVDKFHSLSYILVMMWENISTNQRYICFLQMISIKYSQFSRIRLDI